MHDTILNFLLYLHNRKYHRDGENCYTQMTNEYIEYLSTKEQLNEIICILTDAKCLQPLAINSIKTQSPNSIEKTIVPTRA